MKKYIFFSWLLTILAATAFAQTKVDLSPAPAALPNQVDNAKTMDRQQLITNYLQGVASDITSDAKSATLKASLFALTPKDSTKKFKNDYYLSHSFERNSQLMLGGGLDKSSNFNMISTGFSYDFLNHRDVSMVNTYQELIKRDTNIQKIEDTLLSIETEVDNTYFKEKKTEIKKLIEVESRKALAQKNTKDLSANILDAVSPPARYDEIAHDKEIQKNLRLFDHETENNIKGIKADDDAEDHLAESITYTVYGGAMSAALNTYIVNVAKNAAAPQPSGPGVNSDELNALISQINDHIKADQKILNGTDLGSVYAYLAKQYQAAVAEIANRAMLTGSYAYQYSVTGVKDLHSFSLEYMVGLGAKNSTHVWSLSVIGADSLSSDTSVKSRSLKRNVTDLQVGINRVLFTDKSSTSLFEANLAAEGDLITANKLPGEKWTKGSLNLTLQGRPSAKSPWFKLVLKTDKKANVLGLFSITVNLDNSSNKGG